MSLIDSLNWRYATTKFDTNRVVADTDIKKLKEIVKLSPKGRLICWKRRRLLRTILQTQRQIVQQAKNEKAERLQARS